MQSISRLHLTPLIVIAPTQQSPIFGVSQLPILAMFVLLGRSALKGFKNA